MRSYPHRNRCTTLSRGGSDLDEIGGSRFDGNQQSGGLVTFEPGARSAWHTHPKGQYFVVVSGVGYTQEWGEPIRELRPGDVVWCPPGVKHWHGAAPANAMTHLAVTGTVDGKNVEWMEKVTDEQYNGR
ncbi:(R)-mandelonitrile lyase [Burkholderia ambifaria]|uniref:(R)-mandelonitrile lyase n=1 Tax=Burkholderia ambifaria TaxID=152480 RepID=UPI001FC8B3EB|nr:cupin domain-containing protein [Burkholderia ambifaria]